MWQNERKVHSEGKMQVVSLDKSHACTCRLVEQYLISIETPQRDDELQIFDGILVKS